MWELLTRNREAGAFEDAVAGRRTTAAAEDLAGFMASVADAVRPATPFVSERGWRRLRDALDEPVEQSRVVRGALAPMRSTAILGAAMAGGGLLVAGAASGVDPSLVVRQVILDAPAGLWAPGNDAPASTTSDLTVEGSVVASDRDGIAVDTGTAVVDIRIDRHTRVETVDGRGAVKSVVEVGSEVRVRARLLPDGGLVAGTVALVPVRIPPASVSTPGAAMVQRAPEMPSAAPDLRPREPTVTPPTAPATARATEGSEARTPASGSTPGVRDDDSIGTSTIRGVEPTQSPVAAVTRTVEPTRTSDATVTGSRTPEPTKTVTSPTKTPSASISPGPAETKAPPPVDPTAAPVPADPPLAATPPPGSKRTPTPTNDPDRTIKEEPPLTDSDGAIAR